MSARVTRRQLLAGAGAIGATAGIGHPVLAARAARVRLADGVIAIDIDDAMRSVLSFDGRAVTPVGTADALRLADGMIVDRFALLDVTDAAINDVHGAGRRHTLRGIADGRIERIQQVSFHDRYPGVALIATSYRNVAQAPLAIAGWRTATHDLTAHPKGAWSFAGASYPDRRDWVQKAGPGFEQQNFMGMNASDYGGGTPVAVVWRPDVALAVGHIETVPRLVSLPVAAQPGGTRVGMAGDATEMLAPGETLTLPLTFVMLGRGDHFGALDAYRRIMAERGLAAPAIPQSSYAPVWCAWGYERGFTPAQIVATLPKAKAIGLEWAVMDDGWQTSEGDWKVNRAKFPRGGADMRAFADRVKAAGMRPRLWYSPLAVDPGTDLLRDHPDMLLLDRNGSAQNVSFWDAFTLCPAYAPVVDHHRAQVRRIVGEWGFQGLKLDGQHLNGVAPCYNPAHRHARPEESVEKLQDFWKALYDEAIAADPQAVVEICPCGDSFAFHNIPAMNHTPASDPTSSWQVRLKGKTFKALMGPSAPFAGDHVELSDRHDDFASSYGVGGILSTKFTWPGGPAHPMEPLPPGGWTLTPAREALWRRWIALYRERMLPQGRYLGGLYDIGFDKPEAHAIERDERLHYAFFADEWDGPVTLRGLAPNRRYTLTDGFAGTPLGIATAQRPAIAARFAHFLLVVADPAPAQA